MEIRRLNEEIQQFLNENSEVNNHEEELKEKLSSITQEPSEELKTVSAYEALVFYTPEDDEVDISTWEVGASDNKLSYDSFMQLTERELISLLIEKRQAPKSTEMIQFTPDDKGANKNKKVILLGKLKAYFKINDNQKIYPINMGRGYYKHGIMDLEDDVAKTINKRYENAVVDIQFVKDLDQDQKLYIGTILSSTPHKRGFIIDSKTGKLVKILKISQAKEL